MIVTKHASGLEHRSFGAHPEIHHNSGVAVAMQRAKAAADSAASRKAQAEQALAEAKAAAEAANQAAINAEIAKQQADQVVAEEQSQRDSAIAALAPVSEGPTA